MNTALIIIDIQNNYFEGGKMELYKPEEAAEKAKMVLEFFRKRKLPIFHVLHSFNIKGDPNTIDELRKIHKSVEPIDNEKIIIKQKPSSFLRTDLKYCLDEAKVNKLVVCGMMSHMCIDTTVRAAQDYGYEVVLLEDACATKELETKHGIVPATTVHDVYMAALNRMFANVISVQELIENFDSIYEKII